MSAHPELLQEIAASELRRNNIPVSRKVQLMAYPDVHIYGLEIPGFAAAHALFCLRKIGPHQGFWPVITPRIYRDREPPDVIDDAPPASAILAAGLSLELESWIDQRKQEHPYIADHDDSERILTRILSDPSRRRGLSGLDIERSGTTQEPFESLHLAILPVRFSWEVPALLRPGLSLGPDFPSPELQVAFFRKWYDDFGAEIAVMDPPFTQEFLVAHPPKKLGDARALALEHQLYCTDCLVNARSHDEMATELLYSSCWHFWWD
jgi:hypothetical protein